MDLAREISILKQISHKYIIGLKDVLLSDKYLQIIMEAAQGQELFDVILERKVFKEIDARSLMLKLLDACNYLHELGIVHRDLKPENIIFLDDENDTQTVKIIDFGFARKINVEIKDTRGTLGYKAPETIKGQLQTSKADMWSLGVIAYILLVGYPPFFSHEDERCWAGFENRPYWSYFNEETEYLFQSITEGSIDYLECSWSTISPEAQDFVKSLLTVDPNERSSAKSALSHPWFSLSFTKPVIEVVYECADVLELELSV